MNTILCALAFLVIFARLVRRTRVHGPLVPTSNAAAQFRWSQRFDAQFPADSEARLAMQARGAVAKRRMMAYLRNRPQPAIAPDGLTWGLQRIGIEPLKPVALLVEPLASLKSAARVPQVSVTVRRPKLSLAR